MVLDTIIGGKRAWTSAGKLTKRYGAAAIAKLALTGMIVCWSHDKVGKKLRAPAWTLTAKGAQLSGVHIAESPDELGMGVPYWSTDDDASGLRRTRALATPRYPPARRPKLQVLRDEDGVPIELWGMQVPVKARRGQGRQVGKTKR